MAEIVERTLQTAVHGRYLVSPSSGAATGTSPILVGFHGYAEDATVQMTRLQAVAGATGWPIVSIQALNRFYRGRTQDVVAGWMTRQNRDLAIADNLAYVSAVLAEVAARFPGGRAVFAGFSQGVAMAFRAAAHVAWPVAGVVALGADVPPELSDEHLRRIPATLLGRGNADQWYSAEMFGADVARLTRAGVAVTECHFEGAHDWTAEFTQAAAEFVSAIA